MEIGDQTFGMISSLGDWQQMGPGQMLPRCDGEREAGGPTGVELSGELHDFLEDDLRSWYPELAGHIKLTLVEALPSVLPMFSKQLIDYTE